RARTQQPDPACGEWAIVRNGSFAKQCLYNWRTQFVCCLFERVGRLQSALAGEDGNLFSVIQDLCRSFQVTVAGPMSTVRMHQRGVSFYVALGGFFAACLHVLNVSGEADVGYFAIDRSRAAGKLHYVFHMRWSHHSRVVGCNVHEKPVRCDILLGKGVAEIVKGHSSDREHWLAIKLGVIKSVEQVNCSRAGLSQAHTHLPRIFRMGTRHECCGLFMAHLDKPDLFLVCSQCFHDSVNPISWQSIDCIHSPVNETFNQNVSSSFGHGAFSPRYGYSSMD